MNTFAISALQELRSVPGFEKAIIAGGFIRDTLHDKTPKDLDIFFPCRSSQEFNAAFRGLYKEEIIEKKEDTFLNSSSFSEMYYVLGGVKYPSAIKPWKTNEVKRVDVTSFQSPYIHKDEGAGEYQNFTGKFIGLIKTNYRGILPVDIIAYSLPEEDFAKNVVTDFDYWFNQAYYDDDIQITENFRQDRDNMTMTMEACDPEKLPKAIKKYFRLQEKYPHHQFRANFDIVGREKEQKDYKKEKQALGNAVNRWLLDRLDRNEPVREVRPPEARLDRDADEWAVIDRARRALDVPLWPGERREFEGRQFHAVEQDPGRQLNWFLAPDHLFR